jgi:hypothetical protein
VGDCEFDELADGSAEEVFVMRDTSRPTSTTDRLPPATNLFQGLMHQGFLSLAVVAVVVSGLLVSSLSTPGASASTAPPAVLKFSVLPTRLSFAGGKVSLTASVRHATKCVLTATPALTGYPKTVACTSGQVSLTAVVPRNTSKQKTQTFSIKAKTSSTTSLVKTSDVSVQSPFGWAQSLGVPSGKGFSSVSCASPTFCKAVDNGGDVVTYNGTSWDSFARIDSGQNKLMISCPSTTYCLVVDGNGYYVTWDGTSWSAPVLVPGAEEPFGLTCTSSTFCMMISGTGLVLSFDGTAWSPPVQVLPLPAGGASISCASVDECVAVGRVGSVSVFDGTSWTLTALPSLGLVGTVSCVAGATFCLATAAKGWATYDGSTWAVTLSTGMGANVDCESSTYCVQLVGSNLLVYNGDAWTTLGVALDSTLRYPPSLSCSGTSFCAEVSDQQAITIDPSAWPQPSSTTTLPLPPSGAVLTGVACTTGDWCDAVDANGDVLTDTAGQWSDATPMDSAGQLSGISCESPTFCMAIDRSGSAFTFDGSSWSGPSAAAAGTPLISVACPTSQFCVAVGDGVATEWNDLGWSGAQTIAPGVYLSGVSCISASLCVAVGGDGTGVVYSNGSWSSPADVDPVTGETQGLPLGGVSCSSLGYCFAMDNAGSAVEYDASGWLPPTKVSPFNITLNISCGSDGSCLANLGDFDYAYNGSIWTASSSFYSALSSGLACSNASFCLSVGGVQAGTYDGTSWGPTLPVNELDHGISAVSCATETFCVATDEGGDAFVLDRHSWSAPTRLATLGESLSCPIAEFCVAVAGTDAFIYNGSGWTASVVPSAQELSNVSCSSATFCLATDNQGPAFEYDGTSWTSVAAPFPAPISCVSPTFCASVTGAIFDGIAWSVPLSVEYDGVSCVSTTFCMAATAGQAQVWNGKTWGTQFAAPDGAGSLTCVSSTFCVGGGAVFDGKQWSGEPLGSFGAESCPDKTFCLAASYSQVSTFDPSLLPLPSLADPNGSLQSVSCWAVGSCVTVSNGGYEYTEQSATWSAASLVDPFGLDITAVTCPAKNFCVALDNAGYVLTDTQGTWTVDEQLDKSGKPFDYLSCPSPTFCLAADEYAHAWTFDGSAWTSIGQIPEGGVAGLTCVSSSFCVSVDLAGDFYEFDGSTWTKDSGNAGVNGPGVSMQCVGSSFCIAMGQDAMGQDNVSILNGTSWTTTAMTMLGGTALSCASSNFCVAVSNTGEYSAYNGVDWSPAQTISSGDLVSVSCVSITYCDAVSAENQVVNGSS